MGCLLLFKRSLWTHGNHRRGQYSQVAPSEGVAGDRTCASPFFVIVLTGYLQVSWHRHFCLWAAQTFPSVRITAHTEMSVPPKKVGAFSDGNCVSMRNTDKPVIQMCGPKPRGVVG